MKIDYLVQSIEEDDIKTFLCVAYVRCYLYNELGRLLTDLEDIFDEVLKDREIKCEYESKYNYFITKGLVIEFLRMYPVMRWKDNDRIFHEWIEWYHEMCELNSQWQVYTNKWKGMELI